MASDLSFVEYVCEQIRDAGRVSHLRMFGEFAVYCDGKVVGFVCDNQFFLKPTDAGKALLERVKEAPPYPGAKPYYLIDAQLDDADAAAAIVRATADALPLPTVKTTTASRTRTSQVKAGSKVRKTSGTKAKR